MPLQCNIDSKGKAIRLTWGLINLVIASVLLFIWALPSHLPLPWIITIALFLLAALGIFQARAGWCFVRAMGFKTKY